MIGPPLANARWELFAQGVASGKTATQAYVNAGYKSAGAGQAAERLLRTVEVVRTRVDELKSEIAVRTVDLEITNRNSRLLALQDLADRLRAVMIERAADPAMQAIPGGQTGLLVRQQRHLGKGDEYRVDVALTGEFRATLEQAAKEAGQWLEKSEATWRFDGNISKLPPEAQARMIEQLETVAFGGDQRLIEQAKRDAVTEAVM
jgi:hypothetical protein